MPGALVWHWSKLWHSSAKTHWMCTAVNYNCHRLVGLWPLLHWLAAKQTCSTK